MLYLANYVLTRNCCPPGSGLPSGQQFFNKSIKSFSNWWSGCVFRISIRLPKAISMEKAMKRNCCPPGSEIFHCPVGSSFFLEVSDRIMSYTNQLLRHIAIESKCFLTVSWRWVSVKNLNFMYKFFWDTRYTSNNTPIYTSNNTPYIYLIIPHIYFY